VRALKRFPHVEAALPRISTHVIRRLYMEAPGGASVVVESAVRHGLERERAKVAESHSEAISILRSWLQEGDWILVKGSRRMAMEKIAEGLFLLDQRPGGRS
jgi:UDP-N-acetylmuramoyl-tripeptide--D-alanyl-D-alanine ligase